MELLIDSVRCFTRPNRVRIRPITLVTGENSSGKTTLLASIAAVAGARFPVVPDFNTAPFSLGNYDSIATYKGGKYGRTPYFRLGITQELERDHRIELTAKYLNDRGVAKLDEFHFTSPTISLSLSTDDDGKVLSLGEKGASGSSDSKKYKISDEDIGATSIEDLPFFLVSLLRRGGVLKDEDFRRMYESIVPEIYRFRFSVEALAPLRTKPLRTYDESKDKFSPDGDHIPYILARLFDEARRNKSSEAVVAAVKKFGRDAGLFQDLRVKQLGKNISDPFQILVTVSGRPANLVDVGYGVSQVLPIVVQSLLATRADCTLIQQPEVHLHPRAQAAMGSFFCHLASTNRRSFVVETHSDYIIDRVRQSVAEKSINASDVIILYLEREGHDTNIHEISLDNSGNLVGAPLGYRSFFLQEENRMLELFSQ